MANIGTGSILIVGRPLLDVSFRSNAEFLDQHGLLPDGVLIVDEIRYQALYNDLIAKYKTPKAQIPGGSNQNTARMAQWLLSDHPETVSCMGAIGDDEAGALMMKISKEIHMNAIYQVVDDGTPTGTCLVILNGENRSQIACLGAAENFTTDFLEKNWNAVEAAKFVYVDGFFLLSCLEQAVLLARHVSECPEKKFLLNLSAPFVISLLRERLLDILPYVDVLIGNSVEAICFAKEMLGYSGVNVLQVGKLIATNTNIGASSCANRHRCIVITRGSEPVIVTTISHSRHIDSVVTKLIPVTPIDRSEILDANGVGDAFVGGLLAQQVMSGGKSLEDGIRLGIMAAAIKLRQLGYTFPSEKPTFFNQ